MNKWTTKEGFEVVDELLLLFMMLLQYDQLMLVKGFQLEQLLLALLLCLLQLCEMKDSVVKCLLPSLTMQTNLGIPFFLFLFQDSLHSSQLQGYRRNIRCNNLKVAVQCCTD